MPDSDTTGGSGWIWLAAAVPVVLVGAFVLALSGDTHHPDTAPGCLPDLPTTPTPATGTGGGLWAVVWPIAASAPVSSPFGIREGGEFHQGADFAAAEGTEILAATSGRVVAAGPASGFGNWIVVDTLTDTASTPGAAVVSAVYGHMYDTGVLVRIGEKVTAGQRIGLVGSAGQSSGAHLHFEIVPGGRLSGGTAVDPIAWLTTHAGPRDTTPPVLVASATELAEMAPVPAAKGGETGLQIDAVRLARALAVRFPQIPHFGGVRGDDEIGEHSGGRAIDAMIPDFDTPAGRRLGQDLLAYVHAHAQQFHLTYTLFGRTYTPADRTPVLMPEKGSATADHHDHVHLTVDGGGAPAPNQTYGAAPQATPATTGCTLTTATGGTVGGALAAGTVPEAFAPWITKAANTCTPVSAPLIAAQLENESRFDVNAYNSSSGATGPAQFLPSTWAAKAVDGDGDGTRDPHSIPDAVMSQAAYDCELAEITAAALAEGRLHGDPTELWLSAYNCGPGATLAGGGVCRNPETSNYVRDIPARAREFATVTGGR